MRHLQCRRSFPRRAPKSRSSVPPASVTRSSSSASPTWPSSRRRARCAGVEAGAVVADRRAARRHGDGRRGAPRACSVDVAQRLAHDAVDERVVARRLDLERGLDARRRAAGSAGRRARPRARRLQPRRVDLDQQRAQVAHALAQPRRRCALSDLLLGRAAALRRPAARARTRRPRGPGRCRRAGRRRSGGARGRRPRSRAPAAARARRGRAAGGGRGRRRAGPGSAAGPAAPPSSGGASVRRIRAALALTAPKRW